MAIESIERLDHYGVIAGIFDELGLEAELNTLLGEFEGEKLSIGQTIKGLIINGLGFSDRPLSLVSQFFEEVPIKELIGSEAEAQDFNRHKLGRALDRLYDRGCSEIFSKLALLVSQREGVDTSTVHLDTTSFSVTGSVYEGEDQHAITVTHGYSRDKRPDLKQIVQELVVSGDGGVPLLSKCYSGNANDNKIFEKRSRELVKALKNEDWRGILVADSKLYTSSNAENLSSLKFVTRIPHILKEANAVIKSAWNDNFGWQESETRTFKPIAVTHYGIEQRWIVAYSKESLERATQGIEKKVQSEDAGITKELNRLTTKTFGCEHDATQFVRQLEKKWRFHKIDEITITPDARYSTRGKPAQDRKPDYYEYTVRITFSKNDQLIVSEKMLSASYIIGSNIPEQELSSELVLEKYSEQQKVERGFRFLKEPLFFVSSLFIKKPERIEALVTIMSLSLLIYSVAERRLRKQLAKNNQTIPNQIKQPTSRPTLRWVFQCLFGINIVYAKKIDGIIHYSLVGVNSLRAKILSCFGQRVLNLYRLDQNSSG
jgi:transposase